MTDTQEGSTPTSSSGSVSNYERIGGGSSVKTAVGVFYERVLADPELSGYFVDTDMEEQKRHMVLMLTKVLGGPDRYNGRGLAEAHQPLNIPVRHYHRVGDHLIGTLSQLNVPSGVIGDVRGVLAHAQDQVVSSAGV